MDLSEVYSQKIKKSSVNFLQVAGNFPQIERDPNIKKLEQEVFTKMQSLLPKEEATPKIINNVASLSFEDALKELVEIEKKSISK
jgi:hypothetical protein